MNKKGVAILGIAIGLLILLSIFHNTLHFIIFHTDVPLGRITKVSGLAIGEVTIGDNIGRTLEDLYPNSSAISIAMIAGELVMLLVFIFITTMRKKHILKKETISISQLRKTSSKTDIDLLYELLQKRKIVTMEAVARAFKVKKEVVKDWAEILENGDLAEIDYPRFGEPRIKIIEKDEKEKNKEGASPEKASEEKGSEQASKKDALQEEEEEKPGKEKPKKHKAEKPAKKRKATTKHKAKR